MPDPEVEPGTGGESLRCRRVAEAIKEIAGQVVTQELADPRVGFITITRVKVSPDIRIARVYYSAFGGQADRAKAHAALQHAAGFVRRRVGDDLQLRFTPELIFQYDEGIDKSIRLSELLHEGDKTGPSEELPQSLPPLE